MQSRYADVWSEMPNLYTQAPVKDSVPTTSMYWPWQEFVWGFVLATLKRRVNTIFALIANYPSRIKRKSLRQVMAPVQSYRSFFCCQNCHLWHQLTIMLLGYQIAIGLSTEPVRRIVAHFRRQVFLRCDSFQATCIINGIPLDRK